jgi:hypothetical protein
LIKALGVKPSKPAVVISLGEQSLLSISMTDAAHMFGVPDDVISRRRRAQPVADNQLPLDMQQSEGEVEYA